MILFGFLLLRPLHDDFSLLCVIVTVAAYRVSVISVCVMFIIIKIDLGIAVSQIIGVLATAHHDQGVVVLYDYVITAT